MELKNSGNVELSKTRSIEQLNSGYEMRLFGKTIHNYQKSVETMGWWEISDEIHGNRFPIPTWDLKRVEITIWGVSGSLVSLAEVT